MIVCLQNENAMYVWHIVGILYVYGSASLFRLDEFILFFFLKSAHDDIHSF